MTRCNHTIMMREASTVRAAIPAHPQALSFVEDIKRDPGQVARPAVSPDDFWPWSSALRDRLVRHYSEDLKGGLPSEPY